MKVVSAFRPRTSQRLDRRAVLVCSLLIVAVAACGGSATTTTVGGPTPVKCDVALHASATAFAFGGGSGEISIDTARECEWNASTGAPWIALKARAGQGGGTIQFSVAPNDQPARRTAGVLVNDRRIDLSEDAAPCRVQLSATPPTVGPDGGDGAISIATLSGCRWTAAANAEWIALRDPVSGDGNGQVRFHVLPNAGPERSGAIRVAEAEQVIVQQAAAGPPNPPGPAPAPAPPAPAPPPPPPPSPSPPAPAPAPSPPTPAPSPSPPAPAPSPAPPAPAPSPNPAPPPPSPAPPPPSCTLELDPGSADADAAGGDGRIRVRTPDACSWTALSQSGWVTITAGSGKGNGEVRYRVAPNPNQQPRSGSIAIEDRSFTVRQAGAAPPPTPPSCSFEVDPDSEDFEADGGDDRIRVRTTDVCTWTARTQSNWITITAGAGKGDGEVRYVVAPNGGPSRDGAITVMDQTVKIKQEGASQKKVEIKGDIASLQGACPGLTFSVAGTAVQTNSDTRFKHGSCGSLRNGTRVEIKGVQSPGGGPLLALEVEIKDDDDEELGREELGVGARS